MMIKEAQEWVAEAWKKSPKSGISEKDELLFLLEEIGEIAQGLRALSGNKETAVDLKGLEKEFGDVLLSLLTLSNRYGIDLQNGFLETKKSIEKRYILN